MLQNNAKCDIVPKVVRSNICEMDEAKLHRYNCLQLFGLLWRSALQIDHNSKTRILLRIYTCTYTFMYHYVIARYTIINIHNSVLD